MGRTTFRKLTFEKFFERLRKYIDITAEKQEVRHPFLGRDDLNQVGLLAIWLVWSRDGGRVPTEELCRIAYVAATRKMLTQRKRLFNRTEGEVKILDIDAPFKLASRTYDGADNLTIKDCIEGQDNNSLEHVCVRMGLREIEHTLGSKIFPGLGVVGEGNSNRKEETMSTEKQFVPDPMDLDLPSTPPPPVPQTEAGTPPPPDVVAEAPYVDPPEAFKEAPKGKGKGKAQAKAKEPTRAATGAKKGAKKAKAGSKAAAPKASKAATKAKAPRTAAKAEPYREGTDRAKILGIVRQRLKGGKTTMRSSDIQELFKKECKMSKPKARNNASCFMFRTRQLGVIKMVGRGEFTLA